MADVSDHQRARVARDLKAAGWTWSQVAEHLGYWDRSSAYRAVKRLHPVREDHRVTGAGPDCGGWGEQPDVDPFAAEDLPSAARAHLWALQRRSRRVGASSDDVAVADTWGRVCAALGRP